MVFAGQDKWRSHPLISGCWKRPFPHLGLAIGIFTAYVVAEKVFLYGIAPPPEPYKATIKYEIEEVDKPPKVISKHGHH